MGMMATVTARCRKHSSITSLQYNWNGQGYGDSNVYSVRATSDIKESLTLTVKANDGTNDYTVSFEPVNFTW